MRNDDAEWKNEATPLEPGREWDKPAGEHVGHGAALRVPVSEGPATMVLDRGDTPDTSLMREEPRSDPLRAMEEGPVEHPRLSDLDRPIRS